MLPTSLMFPEPCKEWVWCSRTASLIPQHTWGHETSECERNKEHNTNMQAVWFQATHLHKFSYRAAHTLDTELMDHFQWILWMPMLAQIGQAEQAVGAEKQQVRMVRPTFGSSFWKRQLAWALTHVMENIPMLCIVFYSNLLTQICRRCSPSC